jgi:hypothetical protein
MVHPGVGTVKHEKAVVHDSKPHIDLGIALVSELILENQDFAIVKDGVFRA